MTRRVSVRANLLAIASMLALLLPAAPGRGAAALAADPEIISSVDFDDGTTGTWTQSGSPTLTFVDDGAGGQALSILRAQDFEGIQSPTGLLEHDVVYTLSMRARLPEGTAGSTQVAAGRQAQLHVGRQRHDRRLRLDHDQRHVHPARRGRPRAQPGLRRQHPPGRAVHDPRRRHPDHGARGTAADGDGPEHRLRGRPRRLGPARRRPGRPDRRLTTDESHSPTHAALVSDRTSQGDGIGHDVTGIMDPGHDLRGHRVGQVRGRQPDRHALAEHAPHERRQRLVRHARAVHGRLRHDLRRGHRDLPDGGGRLGVPLLREPLPGRHHAPFLVDDIAIESQAPPVVEDLLAGQGHGRLPGRRGDRLARDDRRLVASSCCGTSTRSRPRTT